MTPAQRAQIQSVQQEARKLHRQGKTTDEITKALREAGYAEGAIREAKA